jgi:hypothetical protein
MPAALNPATLVSRITPTHLTTDDRPQADAILEKVKATEDPEPAPETKDDPRDQEVYTFQLDWTDRRGRRWRGEFTTKILTIAEQQAMGVLRAQYQLGYELSALDAFTGTLNRQLSHLRYALLKRPTWAENLLELSDPELVGAIYDKVVDHESFFRRWLSPAPQG